MFYMVEVLKKSLDDNIRDFKYLVDVVNQIRDQLMINISSLKENNLFYEVLYWGLAVALKKNRKKQAK